ncbi:MAG: hypothetical protein Q7V63_04990 [Gammaproteobacteria bacterium]|nr:hypothetical protein [Gammaproteobacteria bacterium]
MDNEAILSTLTEICETISTRGVYANYAWCSEQLSEILQISDPAEINDIMLNISRLSFLKTTRSVYQWSTLKYASLFGFKERSELHGKLDMELAWGEEVTLAFQAADEQVINNNTLSIVECRATLPDTTERFFKSKLYPVYNPNRQVVGILGVVRELLSSDMQTSRIVSDAIEAAS